MKKVLKFMAITLILNVGLCVALVCLFAQMHLFCQLGGSIDVRVFVFAPISAAITLAILLAYLKTMNKIFGGELIPML